MNNIEMPVFRPTANCIRNAFRNSNKKHLIITGNRESVKTQLLSELFPEKLPFLNELGNQEDVFLVDLDAPYGKNGCVIMASGLGKRFGGNKLMTDFHGIPMISKTINATDGIFSQRIVVTRHKEISDFCKAQGIDVILHDQPYRSDTICIGLDALESDLDGCMFCQGDQPLLRQETVAALALSSVNDKRHIWRTAFGDIPGSPVWFPARFFPELHSLPAGKGGSYITKKYPEQVRTVQVRDKYELKDVDSPTDLIELLER